MTSLLWTQRLARAKRRVQTRVVEPVVRKTGGSTLYQTLQASVREELREAVRRYWHRLPMEAEMASSEELLPKYVDDGTGT